MIEPSIEFDTVFGLCQHKHRRIVLAALADQHQQIPVNDLAGRVVKYDHHTSLPEMTDETISRIEASLHHVHLPRLEEAELIEYDHEQHLVEQTARFDQVKPHLSTILDVDPVLSAPLGS